MSPKIRRRLIVAVSSLVGAVVLVLGGTYLYINVIAGDAPPPLTLDPSGSAGNDALAGDQLDLDGTWSVADGSEAGYRVDEVLNGQDNTVVGRTSDVTGQVTVSDGTATSAEVTLDMTTVTTDSDARDSQFKGTIMQTSDFPTSTFTLTEPVDLGELGSGPVSLTAQGELTVRDVTRPVEVDLELQIQDGGVQAAGSIDITFEDFGISPPDLGFVKVEDAGVVEFLLAFEK